VVEGDGTFGGLSDCRLAAVGRRDQIDDNLAANPA
jgi:hypothetical protein